MSQFNYENYKKNPKKYQDFDEKPIPQFITLDKIVESHRKEIEILWDKNKGKIFDNLNDLLNIKNEGKIFKKLLEFLTKENNASSKDNQEITERKFQVDEMINKIKTNLYESIHSSVNSFEEFKFSLISKIKKEKINSKIKADFNLAYLKQCLYSIISNDSSETNGKIIKIMQIILY